MVVMWLRVQVDCANVQIAHISQELALTPRVLKTFEVDS